MLRVKAYPTLPYPGAYPRVETPLWKAPAYFANIRYGWKDLSVTNTLAYYELSKITEVKVLLHHALWPLL
jgi:hypothetical protein